MLIKEVEIKMKKELLFPEEDFFPNIRSELAFSLPMDTYEDLREYLYGASKDNFINDLKRIFDTRPRTIKYFYDKSGRPITNYVKGLVRQALKERDIKLEGEDEIISRLLNRIREWYGEEGVLEVRMYEPEAFYKFAGKYGDKNSCFRKGGCNDGHAYWIITYMKNEFRYITVHYLDNEGNYMGGGRFWLYIINENAVFITNFYSTGFEIKRDAFKYPIVAGVRELMGWDKCKFSRNDIVLPIYLNGDGYIIWKTGTFKSHEEVAQYVVREKYGFCMNCGEEFKLSYLECLDGNYYMENFGRTVGGGIVCSDCATEVERGYRCEYCGTSLREDEVYLVDDLVLCEVCFDNYYVYCDICNRIIPREEACLDAYDNYLCESCFVEYRYICEECEEAYDDEDICVVFEAYIGEDNNVKCVERTICRGCLEYKKRDEDYAVYTCRFCGGIALIPKWEIEKSELLKELADNEICPDLYCVNKFLSSEKLEEVA